MNEQILRHMRKNLNPDYVTGLLDLIDTLPEHIDMIEIGCYAGESAKLFLDSGKINLYIAIDPYINQYDENDIHAHAFNMDIVYKVFVENIIAKYANTSLIKATSDKALPYFLRAQTLYDFVYIDGNHQYTSTLNDIQNYLPLIKKGGIIAGHDYNEAWDSVRLAVNKVFGKPDKIFIDSSWMVQL